MPPATLEPTNGSKSKSAHASQEKRLLDLLAQIGGHRVKDDALVRQGQRFIIPETMTPMDAMRWLGDYIKKQEQVNEYSRTFRYHPKDVANAFQLALYEAFGTMGIGKSIMTFFGEQPPQMRTIEIGAHGETTAVPWGMVRLEALEADINIGGTRDRDLGIVGQLVVTAPKKHEARVQGLFELIEGKLQTDSIYRGKCITAQPDPGFWDPYTVDPNEFVWTDDTLAHLQACVFTPLEQHDRLRRQGKPLKLSSLLEGPYGTGKTSLLAISAQKAMRNGWTVIQVRPDRDDLRTGFNLARIYQRALLVVEDIDGFASGDTEDPVRELLDMFDGVSAKNTEIVVAMTTNFKEKIHKGMIRPGRLDSVIHIGVLAPDNYVDLVRALIDPKRLQLTDEDEERVGEAFRDFPPAYVRGTIDHAWRYAVSRDVEGKERVTGDDLVHAANMLRIQLDLQSDAPEGRERSTADDVLRRVTREAINGTVWVEGMTSAEAQEVKEYQGGQPAVLVTSDRVKNDN